MKKSLAKEFPLNMLESLLGNVESAKDVNADTFLEILLTLDDDQQEYIRYRFNNDLTFKQCAEKLNITPDQARNMQAKIFRYLRKPEIMETYRYVPYKAWRETNLKYESIYNENKQLNNEIENLQAILLNIMDSRIDPASLVKLNNTIKTPIQITLDDIKQDYGMSNRTYNSLNQAGLFTLHDLQHTSHEVLSNIRGIGSSVLYEIRDIVNYYSDSKSEIKVPPAIPPIPLDKLNLSKDARVTLTVNGIYTLQDLYNHTGEIKTSFGVSTNSYDIENEIKLFIEHYNIPSKEIL